MKLIAGCMGAARRLLKNARQRHQFSVWQTSFISTSLLKWKRWGTFYLFSFHWLSNFFRALVFEIRRVLFIPDFTFYITPMDALRHTTKCSDSCTLINLLMSIIVPVRCSGLAHIHVVWDQIKIAHFIGTCILTIYSSLLPNISQDQILQEYTTFKW